MIETLRIRNLALVESAELAFGTGLNVLTGETGAGKSLILGALALLAGSRASADAVRSGAREAVVEAVFRSAAFPGLARELAARGLADEEDELIVRRSVAPGGRSRAFVGGAQVPVAVLAELFGARIEIASQHESQTLLRGDVQSRLLDAHAGLLERRAAVEAGVRQLHALDEELARLRGEAEQRAQREDFLAFQIEEIDAAALDAGEGERLRAERTRLFHAERLREDAARAAVGLVGDPSCFETPAAVDLLGEAGKRVASLAAIDASLEPLAGRLRDAHALAADAAAELERYAAGIEAEPGRLGEVEERLARLERLRRKYASGGDEAAILAFRERAAEERAALGGADARLAKLESERGQRLSSLESDVAALSRGRARVAGELAASIAAALGGLAIPDARFEVALEPVAAEAGLPCGPSGAEAVEFRFSANAGELPRSLRRVASGGELSRVFLGIKNVLRRAERGALLVFDEVDAGIGGPVADRVGAVLAELAGEHQVLCISHLPQIAARASVHWRVAKHGRDGRTEVAVERLDTAGRIEEIARMAGGARISEATRRHARALLEAAGTDPAGRDRT